MDEWVLIRFFMKPCLYRWFIEWKESRSFITPRPMVPVRAVVSRIVFSFGYATMLAIREYRILTTNMGNRSSHEDVWVGLVQGPKVPPKRKEVTRNTRCLLAPLVLSFFALPTFDEKGKSTGYQSGPIELDARRPIQEVMNCFDPICRSDELLWSNQPPNHCIANGSPHPKE